VQLHRKLDQISQESVAAPAIATIAESLLALRPPGGFGAILVDPPWQFAVRSPKGEGRSARRHYNTDLTLEELAALPLGALAAPHCWFFLWSTTPMLPKALWLSDRWGLTYSGTAFVWAKLNKSGVGFHMGCGFTTRKNVELCLLARRGHPRIKAHDVRELIVAPRREHSRKPDEQYERIERLVDGPYLEMFARSRRRGWVFWGDQLDHFEPGYDPLDDITKSVAEGFRAIRKRVAAGGRGWRGGCDD
jgi:N6-adenosine-specific RNA methylase IME4